MKFGEFNIVTSRHLPEGKFYLVGGDIVMAEAAYKRAFSWLSLEARVKDDFKNAEAEFNRVCGRHGIGRSYSVWIRDYDPAESTRHTFSTPFSKVFFSKVQTPLSDLLQRKPEKNCSVL